MLRQDFGSLFKVIAELQKKKTLLTTKFPTQLNARQVDFYINTWQKSTDHRLGFGFDEIAKRLIDIRNYRCI